MADRAAFNALVCAVRPDTVHVTGRI